MMLERARDHRSHQGFTLVEMLVAMGLAAVLMTLGAGAIRNYWFTQSLYGGRDELTSQIRRAQQQAISASRPQVFGVRIEAGSSDWGLVQYDPSTTPATCRQLQSNQFQSRTRVAATPAPSFAVTAETTFCRANLVYAQGGAIVPDRGTSEYILFYARGTATGGSATLEHPDVVGDDPSITVTPLTGRVSDS